MAVMYLPTHAEWENYCKKVKLNTGIEMAYIELGNPEKDTLVLVHGFSDASVGCHAIVGCLQNDFHIYCIDLRGHGLSSKPKQYAYHIMQLRDDVVDFLDQMGIEKCYMAGESMGSMLIQAVAFSAPERVIKAGMFSAFGSLHNSPEQLQENLQNFEDWFENGVSVEEFMPMYKTYKEPEIMPAAMKLLKDWPLHCWQAGWRGMVISDTRCFLQYIKAPTIVIWGEEDDVVSPEMKEEFRSLMPNAKYVILKNRGHNIMQEAPDDACMYLKKFFLEE